MATDEPTAGGRRSLSLFDFGFRVGAGLTCGVVVAIGLPVAGLQLAHALWRVLF